MDYDADTPAVVLDVGSGILKAGFSGNDTPSVVMPSIAGTPTKKLTGVGTKDLFVGTGAQSKREMLKLKPFIERGVVTDWDTMEKVWSHTFLNELRADPAEMGKMVADAPLTSKSDREKATQIMFETFSSPSLYFVNQAVTNLYAEGRMTGVSVDSGYGVTHVVPIHDGGVLPRGVQVLGLGGSDITDTLARYLKRNPELASLSEHELTDVVDEIKKRRCQVVLDPDAGEEVEDLVHTLPDGSEIVVGGRSTWSVTEVLFHPAMSRIESDGLHSLVASSVSTCEAALHRTMYENITLAGGNTLLNGFTERMTAELRKLAPSRLSRSVKVHASPSREYSAWTGGSILSSLSTFEEMWVTSAAYDEAGPSVIHKHCA